VVPRPHDNGPHPELIREGALTVQVWHPSVRSAGALNDYLVATVT